MAERHQVYQKIPEPLQPFVIPDVRPIGKQLGVGSYGSVEELEINGMICAGKKIHEILIASGNLGEKGIAGKFVEEIKLMADLKHPHLVQFLGVCFLPDSSLPVIVMERLLTSLDGLLEENQNEDMPLSLKRSMLRDVARGLTYLHNRNPPVIHRDLSAKNVLLDSAMVAKISDFGNFRLVDLQAAMNQTRVPGTTVYMPPEAFDPTPSYGPALDSFSFGQLALYVVIQVFPCQLENPTYRDPQTKRLLARSEIERRDKYINQLHHQLGEQHSLVKLIKTCLANEPSERPRAIELLNQLEKMQVEFEDCYEHLNKLEMMKRQRSRATTQSELQQLPEELLAKTVADLQVQVREMDAKMAGLQEHHSKVLASVKAELDAKEVQIQAKDSEIFRLKAAINSTPAVADEKEKIKSSQGKRDEMHISNPINFRHSLHIGDVTVFKSIDAASSAQRYSLPLKQKTRRPPPAPPSKPHKKGDAVPTFQTYVTDLEVNEPLTSKTKSSGE